MTLWMYYPDRVPCVEQISLEEDPYTEGLLVRRHSTTSASYGTLDCFLKMGYGRTCREAIEKRIETQKRVILQEARLLVKAEKDLADCAD